MPPFDSSLWLWNPVREYVHHQIRIIRIIRLKMNCEVVWSVHTLVHHELTGLNSGAFTGFESHRTDGELRRSAALHDFDVGLFLEAQGSIACVGNLDGK